MLSMIEYTKHPKLFFASLLRAIGFLFPDKLYLQLLYYLIMGKRLSIKNPRTFGEKIQWLKLYDRRPEYAIMVDKYAAKKYVTNLIGSEYVIPVLGVWDRPEDINFDGLPQQFVLKTTHGGGSCGVIICKNKGLMDREGTIKRLNSALKYDVYNTFREWPYKNVPHRIIAEPYISNSSNSNQDLTDYKFYCFNGVPTYCQVIKDRHTKETIDFFDMEWRHLSFYGLNPNVGPAEIVPAKPIHFDKMKEIAHILSERLTFSRIDLYDANDGPLFGEITLYPASGIGTFNPYEYNAILGEMIKLPNR